MLFAAMVVSWRSKISHVMRDAWNRATVLFDYDRDYRGADHEAATKTPAPFDFAPKGPHKLAQGKGDASCASVAVALGRRGFSVSILFHGNASALKGRNTRCPCLRRPFKARAGVVISCKLL